jgi:hypothetical protein
MKTLHLPIIIFAVMIICVLSVTNFQTFAAGLIPIESKNTTMGISIQSEPDSLNLMSPQDRQIHMRFLDVNTNHLIENVTFAMYVTKGNQTFLQNTFWTQSGSFTLNLKPGERYLWTANPDHDPINGLYYSKGDQIDIWTSYLTEDMYHFSIQPVVIDSNNLSQQNVGGRFETDLNLLDIYNKTLTPDTNLISQQISYNQTTTQVAKPIVNQECVDKIMAQEHAQDMPIDNARALDLATNYTQYKLKTMGHNYTLNRIYHDFGIDRCTAQIKDVIVEFVEKNSIGHSLITITEDLGPNRVKTLDISQVNDEPVTYVDAYMTPTRPQIENDLILLIVLVIGVISVVLFFIFKKRRKK